MITPAGAVTVKWVACDCAPTVIKLEVPAIEAVTVSAAVIVWPPAVLSVAEKVPVPLVSVELAGSTA
jgi:hypothetical protein